VRIASRVRQLASSDYFSRPAHVCRRKRGAKKLAGRSFSRAESARHAADLVRHVRLELAAPKTPAQWIVLDAFPLTGSGKIQKFVLRDRYVAGEFAGRVLECRTPRAQIAHQA
jgi:acyl-CoA synthetase (AMP-forming)/AMP-acid ligase II